VSNTVWACARLGIGKEVLRLLARSADVHAGFNSTELASYAWAYGFVGFVPETPGWAASLWICCDAQLATFRAQELAMFLLACARLRAIGPEDVINRAALQLARLLPSCEPQTVSNGLLALAKLGCTEQDAVAALVLRGAELAEPSIAPQNVANLLWATAMLRHDPGSAVVGKLVTRVMANVTILNAADLTQLGEALARLDYRPGPTTMAAFRSAVTQRRSDLNPHETGTLRKVFQGPMQRSLMLNH
jgi:hypothetical protein